MHQSRTVRQRALHTTVSISEHVSVEGVAAKIGGKWDDVSTTAMLVCDMYELLKLHESTISTPHRLGTETGTPRGDALSVLPHSILSQPAPQAEVNITLT